MERDKNKMADRIINLTIEMLFRLTGEDYTVVKKSSSGRCRAPVCERWGRTLSPILGPPSHSLIHEEIDEQKILEHINRMMELMTGEVPIRCQDVAVYFTMEEWEYVEGHMDQYQDIIMMEDQQLLTSQDGVMDRNPLERCPHPLYSQDCPEGNVPEKHQEEDLTIIKVETDEEERMRGHHPCMWEVKEEIPGGVTPGKNNRGEVVMLSLNYKVEDTMQRSSGENHRPQPALVHVGHHSTDLPYNPPDHMDPCLDQSQAVTTSTEQRGRERFQCDEGGKQFTFSHTEEKLYSCLECGKCFSLYSEFIRHERNHTLAKPYSCSECGKCFSHHSQFIRHERNHTGEKPYSCSACGNSFTRKLQLVTHERIHTGEKPYPCSKCGKRFTSELNLILHKRSHKR